MDEVKQVFAKNLVKLRKAAGLTQFELAEKICYSDKAVSKWERGEAIPDVSVLIGIADVFNVTLDELVRESVSDDKIKAVEVDNELRNKNKARLGLMIAGITFSAILICEFIVFMSLSNSEFERASYAFLYPLPVFAIVSVIFSAIWGGKISKCVAVSALVWSLLFEAFLIVYTATSKFVWLIFVLGIPAQIIVLLCYKIVRLSRNKKR